MNVLRRARLACFSFLVAWLGIAAATAAQAAGWAVDPAKSHLGFSGVQVGQRFQGQFRRWNATIDFDPNHLDGSRISVTVDLSSAATGDTQRDTALPGPDWFDVAHHPRAVFESTTVRHVDGNRYEAAGKLTLRGVSKPLILPFTLEIRGPSAHAEGHVDILRSAFGVGQGQWASGQWVAVAVGVNFNITARQGH